MDNFVVEIVITNGQTVVRYNARDVEGSAYLWLSRYYDLEESSNLVAAP